MNPALPQKELLERQAQWLAPARSRLLRHAGIAHRHSVLDLGAGYGAVTAELARRSSGQTIAFDITHDSLCEISQRENDPILPVNGNALSLPFPDNCFDLIFCQCSLMWFGRLETAVSEIARTLKPGGILVALEPDYGGLIEHPPQLATRDLWLAGLQQAAADPFTGRKLPGILSRHNLTMRINLLDEIQHPSQHRFDFLRGLPLTAEQHQQLTTITQKASDIPLEQQIAHLPFFLITAEKPSTN